jgi:hypothetical protein
MYSRNTTIGQWRAHGRYIARESAAGDQKGTCLDSGGTDREPAQILEAWQRAGDSRLWKLIVSPEFSDRLNLDDLTRNLIRRMEQDLGTKLEWVAVPHFNTEHPHVHIALRGIRDDGTKLHLGRDYVRSGIRTHAEELCTRQLGLRSSLDAIEAERREITARRYTSLDRHISRAAAQTEVGATQADATQFLFEPRSPVGGCSPQPGFDRAQHVAARLGVLRAMGLAEEIGPSAWRVRRDFGTVLKAMQVAGDRQKTLAAHGALISDARLQIAVLDQRKLSNVEGRVLAHGEEETGKSAGRHYMLLEGTDARVHLIYHTSEMHDARSRGRLRTNSFVRLQKQFENGRPVLEITDLGTADRILRDRHHFEDRAQALLRRGFTPRNEGWGGWLGSYQTALAQAAEVQKAKHVTIHSDWER